MISRPKVIDETGRYNLLIHGELANWPSDCRTGDEFVAQTIANYAKAKTNIADALAGAWGELNQFPGSWTVIVQEMEFPNRILIMTDLLGRDQLYYHVGSHKVSDRVFDFFDGKIDSQYISAVAKFGYYIGVRTYADWTFRAIPGNLTILGPRGEISHRILTWTTDPTLSKPEQLKDIITSSFYHNIQEALMNKPEGLTILVSGGLDSSIMAHLVMEDVRAGGPLSEVKLQFLTIPNGDDIEHAKILAEKEGFELEFIEQPDEIGEDLILSALIAADSPVDLGSLIPNYQLIKAAKYPHILTGDGPDEMFGGYSRIHEYDSQRSDIYHELSYYHLPKLTNTAGYLDHILICPYLDPSVLQFALRTEMRYRTDKAVLKMAFGDDLPEAIVTRNKFALKSSLVRRDKLAHRMNCIRLFQEHLKLNK